MDSEHVSVVVLVHVVRQASEHKNRGSAQLDWLSFSICWYEFFRLRETSKIEKEFACVCHICPFKEGLTLKKSN